MKKELPNPEMEKLIRERLIEIRKRSLRNAMAKKVLAKLQEKN